jgi:hypothetical protein
MGNIGVTEIILLLVILVGPLLLFKFLRNRDGGGSGELVECRSCRRRISPRAEACPNCGEPRLPLRG